MVMDYSRTPFFLGGIVVLLAIAWFATRPVPATGEPVATSTPPTTATTTVAAGTSTPAAAAPAAAKPKTLPPEQPFVLPAGAVAVDEYSYVQNGNVYFRSLTGKSPLNVWDANAERFHRVADFMTYPGTAVVNDCGAAPMYTYYTDNRRLYFYQIWRAPTFRTSKVEAVVDAEAESFRITDATTSRDGSTLYTVGYQKATSTCMAYLSKTPL